MHMCNALLAAVMIPQAIAYVVSFSQMKWVFSSF